MTEIHAIPVSGGEASARITRWKNVKPGDIILRSTFVFNELVLVDDVENLGGELHVTFLAGKRERTFSVDEGDLVAVVAESVNSEDDDSEHPGRDDSKLQEADSGSRTEPIIVHPVEDQEDPGGDGGVREGEEEGVTP